MSLFESSTTFRAFGEAVLPPRAGFPGVGDTAAFLRVEQTFAALPPLHRAGFHAALLALAAAWRAEEGGRFADAPLEARTRWVAGLADSRFGPVRIALQIFKGLVLLGYVADPEVRRAVEEA